MQTGSPTTIGICALFAEAYHLSVPDHHRRGGVRVEHIEETLMQEIRYLDKLRMN